MHCLYCGEDADFGVGCQRCLDLEDPEGEERAIAKAEADAEFCVDCGQRADTFINMHGWFCNPCADYFDDTVGAI